MSTESSLVTGFFPVAVCSCFGLGGIDLMMGNDIAGSKVCPAPVDIAESEQDCAQYVN